MSTGQNLTCLSRPPLDSQSETDSVSLKNIEIKVMSMHGSTSNLSSSDTNQSGSDKENLSVAGSLPASHKSTISQKNKNYDKMSTFVAIKSQNTNRCQTPTISNSPKILKESIGIKSNSQVILSENQNPDFLQMMTSQQIEYDKPDGRFTPTFSHDPVIYSNQRVRSPEPTPYSVQKFHKIKNKFESQKIKISKPDNPFEKSAGSILQCCKCSFLKAGVLEG